MVLQRATLFLCLKGDQGLQENQKAAPNHSNILICLHIGEKVAV